MFFCCLWWDRYAEELKVRDAKAQGRREGKEEVRRIASRLSNSSSDLSSSSFPLGYGRDPTMVDLPDSPNPIFVERSSTSSSATAATSSLLSSSTRTLSATVLTSSTTGHPLPELPAVRASSIDGGEPVEANPFLLTRPSHRHASPGPERLRQSAIRADARHAQHFDGTTSLFSTAATTSSSSSSYLHPNASSTRHSRSSSTTTSSSSLPALRLRRSEIPRPTSPRTLSFPSNHPQSTNHSSSSQSSSLSSLSYHSSHATTADDHTSSASFPSALPSSNRSSRSRSSSEQDDLRLSYWRRRAGY